MQDTPKGQSVKLTSAIYEELGNCVLKLCS